MKDHSMDRRQFLLLTLQFLALASMPACRKQMPTLGAAGITDLFVVEDHSQFLAHWAAQGVRDAVLVNLDTHDDFHPISSERIRRLLQIYQHKDWPALAKADASMGTEGLYDIGNWIFAGARLGMFKEVYWVIPHRLTAGSEPDSRVSELLASIGFSAADIKTFTYRDNLYRGTVFGIPVTVCTIETLPKISQPLLLSIDTDYFPTFITEHEVSYLTALNTVFTSLFSRQYELQAAGLCYSVNGEFLVPHHRWVGDAAREILTRPAVLSQPVPTLLALQQEVDNAYRSRDALAMQALLGRSAAGATDPALLLYRALAYQLQGKEEQAFAAAMASCKADKLYAAAFPYLGALYFAKGQYAPAERFFQGGYAVAPQLSNGLMQYGICLAKNGKPREALAVLERDVRRNGSFPTHFLMVQIYHALGDRVAALATLKLALKNLETSVNTRVESQMVADAIYATLDFADQEHYRDLGSALRTTPTVTQMQTRYPRHR